MSRVTDSPDIIRLKDDSDRFLYISRVLRGIIDVINGQLELQDNLAIGLVDVNFQTANISQFVNHGLLKIPTGYWVVGASAAMIVYDGSGGKNKTSISLQSSAVGAAKILFF